MEEHHYITHLVVQKLFVLDVHLSLTMMLRYLGTYVSIFQRNTEGFVIPFYWYTDVLPALLLLLLMMLKLVLVLLLLF